MVSSSSGEQQVADASLPVIDTATGDESVLGEEPPPPAANQTAPLASSPSSELRSSKRSTQRGSKSSHKSSSVSYALLLKYIASIPVCNVL